MRTAQSFEPTPRIPSSLRGVQKLAPARARDDLLATPIGVHNGRRMQSDMSALRMGAQEHRARGYWDTVMDGRAHGVRPVTPAGHRCSDCGNMYRTGAELRTHKKTKHAAAQARPYQCSTCPSQFSQRSHLNQHVRTVHEKHKPFHCNDCGKSFGKRFDLNAHVDAVHNKERPHGCPHCPTQFAKRSNLKRHIEKLHPHAPQYLPRR